MPSPACHCLYVVIAIVLMAPSSLAQPPSRLTPKQQQEQQRRMEAQRAKAIANQPKLPNDPQLLSLHKEFIMKAEKLAAEYERKKQHDRAREVYESLVRLVPKYASAEAGLARAMESQASEDMKMFRVEADDAWQDAGVTLLENMPVYFDVQGTWKVVYETDHKGIEIPKEMKPRNSHIQLGTLIGIVGNTPAELEKSQPFPVQPGVAFKAPKTGRLYLRMYDIDPSDNEGQMLVRIRSTFAK